MNLESNKLIFQKLEENYQYISSLYKEENILGLFAYGKDNKSLKMIYIPTFEELCFNNSLNSIIYNKDNDTIIVEPICSNIAALLVSNIFLTEYKIINPNYELLFNSFILNKTIENIEEVKAGVIEIIKHSFKISNTDFSDNLTIAEKEGLDYILSQIGKEGIVSINNLSKETGISRPVFNNLIAKMKTAKVAIIQNMGAKGTYIKITNLNLLKKGEK